MSFQNFGVLVFGYGQESNKALLFFTLCSAVRAVAGITVTTRGTVTAATAANDIIIVVVLSAKLIDLGFQQAVRNELRGSKRLSSQGTGSLGFQPTQNGAAIVVQAGSIAQRMRHDVEGDGTKELVGNFQGRAVGAGDGLGLLRSGGGGGGEGRGGGSHDADVDADAGKKSCPRWPEARQDAVCRNYVLCARLKK